jgi:hypothetical protein
VVTSSSTSRMVFDFFASIPPIPPLGGCKVHR